MKKFILIILLLSIVVSCKKVPDFALSFENPQPINESELSKIPKKFRGLFMDSDSNYINIKENIILKQRLLNIKIHKSELDSLKKEFNFINNRYVSKITKDVFDFRKFGDSIEFLGQKIDTFFIFSNTEKAKRFNGQLILNYKDSTFWSVKSIRLEKNVLNLREYYFEEDLKKIDSLTKIKSTRIDSLLYISKPSRSEFKQILELKNIGFESEYKRIIK